MMKITGPTETPQTPRAKKAAKSATSFRSSAPTTSNPSGASAASETQPAAMLRALIDLQSEGGGQAKTLAAAQRTLDLLDRLRLGLLEGEAKAADLEALAAAAGARAHAGADARLLAVYDEIALRARVELAKLGR